MATGAKPRTLSPRTDPAKPDLWLDLFSENNILKVKGKELMLTDIEIAQGAKMKKITEIAAGLGISDDELEQYGQYKAKLSESSLLLSIRHLQVKERPQ